MPERWPVRFRVTRHYVKNVKPGIDLAFKGAGTEADISPWFPSPLPVPKMFNRNLPAYGLFLRHVRDMSIDGNLVAGERAETRARDRRRS
jgi:hypothetical protein